MTHPDTTRKEPVRDLVVVGSSAGGVEALPTLVATLPADFPAPIVLAQHLDPNRASHLGEILAARGALPVRTVTGEEPLEPGVVYVVPANRHVRITDHHVDVGDGEHGRVKPSVDLLLSTAAQVFGERLIAVILTGMGSDGGGGARDVKAAGGTVIIQNPETARFPAMPESLAPTTVDIIADLANIGPILHGLLNGAYLPPHASDSRAVRAFLEQLHERSGIDFSSYRTPTIMRRLQRRIAASGAENLNAYLHYVASHPDEYRKLVSSFLIKVTEFFRDPELFAYLREHVLPELIATAGRRGNELRLWSAGCATGEEAYSLAILVAEALGDDLERFSVRIFATDLDPDAIAFARRGVYPEAALAALAPALVTRYFSRVDDLYEVKKRIRALTVFGQHDLGQRAPFPRIDLCLCRNVLIYVTNELQKRALQLFAFSLRDGGYLVLGKAETTSPLAESFTPADGRLKIYRRGAGSALAQDGLVAGPVSRLDPLPLTPPREHFAARRALGPSAPRPDAPGAPTSSEKLGGYLLRMALGLIVVDRRYDIQAINGTARRQLNIHSPATGDDFIHLATDIPSIELRAAIDSAFQTSQPASLDEVPIADPTTGGTTYLQLTCHPQRSDEAGPVEAVMVLVSDVTRTARERRDLKDALARRQQDEQRTAARIAELVARNQTLLQANEELAGANLELRGANEEFLVGNEETQAATEELETLNEELQAATEELETLNEELQATVEELNTTNDDLQARSLELQDLAVSLEAQRYASETERQRLATTLSSMADAVLVVNSAGTVVLTNAAYAGMFDGAGGAGADIEPEDEHGRPLPAALSPRQRAARGEPFSMEFSLTRATLSGTRVRRQFEARGQPIPDGKSGGMRESVVVIRDMTERSLRRLQDEFLAMASHELRTPLTPMQGYLELLIRLLPSAAPDGRVTRYATQALTQTKRLRALVDDLLDVGRLESGKLRLQLTTVDLAPLTARAVEAAQMGMEGQTLALQSDPGPVPVQGDAARLEQVLSNLLSNAVKYAPGTARIDVRLRRAGEEAVLQVQDYGPGIAAADVPHLFSRFYQVTRADRDADTGLGLGLFITQELVTAHGGTIDVASTEGQGATFTVRLPLLEALTPEPSP